MPAADPSARPPWWTHGVVYEVYVRSFADSDGDGIGDLDGITARLDHVAWLGADAVWLTPFYRSPMADFGYDISDHTEVDPLFGDLAAFDRLLARAHALDLRVLVDFVPNHTSVRHPWFRESRSSRDNPRRDWYIWRDPRPDGSPPNNWLSLFGGSAWTFDSTTDQSYLHTFLPEQPDLDWRNPRVRDAMHDVARFWLERGVDGFRIDVASAVGKDAELRDNPPGREHYGWQFGTEWESQEHRYDIGYANVHDIWREFRAVIDGYDRRDWRDRVLIGEVPAFDLAQWVRYYGTALDALHLPFGFHLVRHDWASGTVGDVVERVETVVPSGAVPNWVLGNHDQPRIASWAGPERTRVATMLLLALRGSPTLYYGDEVGLPDVPVPSDRIRDPWGRRLPERGRDRARSPMPWTPEPGRGFTRPGVEPWLPMVEPGAGYDVSDQRDDPRSMLSLTRALLVLRRSSPALSDGRFERISADVGRFVFQRVAAHETLVVALNVCGDEARVATGGHGRVVLSTAMDRTDEAVDETVALRPFEGVVVRLA